MSSSIRIYQRAYKMCKSLSKPVSKVVFEVKVYVIFIHCMCHMSGEVVLIINQIIETWLHTYQFRKLATVTCRTDVCKV